MISLIKKQLLSIYNHDDRIFFWSFAAIFFETLLIITAYGIFYSVLPDYLPLYYSLPWGDKQLIQKPQFIILPGILVLTALLNIIISWHLHPTQIILMRIIYVSSAFISTLFLITAFKIFFIFI